MKKIIYYSLLVCSGFVVSCDKGFDETNTNKVDPTAIDPIFQLNNAIFSAAYPTSTVTYDVGIVQQTVTPNSGVLTGANFNQDARDNTQVIWQNYFEMSSGIQRMFFVVQKNCRRVPTFIT